MNSPLFDKRLVQQDFNKAAATYDSYAVVQRHVSEQLFARFIEQIGEEAHVLDAGCGTGYFHELCRKNGYRFPVLQYDLAYNMCHLAASYASEPPYGVTWTINGDVEQLPLQSQSIDGIFSSLTLQWVNRLDACFSEMHRVLVPGGVMAVATLLPGTLKELEASFAYHKLQNPVSPFVSLNTVYDHMQHAGFTQIEVQHETYSQYFTALPDLLHSLKHIGARNKNAGGRPGFIGKSTLQSLNAHYASEFNTPKGLQASWQVVYLIGKRP